MTRAIVIPVSVNGLQQTRSRVGRFNRPTKAYRSERVSQNWCGLQSDTLNSTCMQCVPIRQIVFVALQLFTTQTNTTVLAVHALWWIPTASSHQWTLTTRRADIWPLVWLTGFVNQCANSLPHSSRATLQSAEPPLVVVTINKLQTQIGMFVLRIWSIPLHHIPSVAALARAVTPPANNPTWVFPDKTRTGENTNWYDTVILDATYVPSKAELYMYYTYTPSTSQTIFWYLLTLTSVSQCMWYKWRP